MSEAPNPQMAENSTLSCIMELGDLTPAEASELVAESQERTLGAFLTVLRPLISNGSVVVTEPLAENATINPVDVSLITEPEKQTRETDDDLGKIAKAYREQTLGIPRMTKVQTTWAKIPERPMLRKMLLEGVLRNGTALGNQIGLMSDRFDSLDVTQLKVPGASRDRLVVTRPLLQIVRLNERHHLWHSLGVLKAVKA